MDLPESDRTPASQQELSRLREENARLKALLVEHGIAWEERFVAASAVTPEVSALLPSHLTLQRNLKNKPLIVPWLTC